MSTAIFLDYPEFVLAALAGGIFLLFGIQNGQISVPGWMSAPSVSIISLLPEKYLHWLSQKLMWSGWRSNTAFGVLATAKIFLPFITLLMFFLILQPVLLLVSVSLFFLPDIVLVQSSKRRQEKIKEMLPQALDLMILCVDAAWDWTPPCRKLPPRKARLCRP